ncbi:kinase-like protein [Fomitiporia mediterranea MF3/22]|uniref:kinase-like protein n=1 Tax=Fomitiporia mediterranea (strain MF3/22) TaxID=694068 RepID=UPI0004409929|nr:kinase-like protein [Fomitiporia mediterranea MF3/22]EJD07980.1 kinase-like protein [Fomitiporia mediterranea MF3/22]
MCVLTKFSVLCFLQERNLCIFRSGQEAVTTSTTTSKNTENCLNVLAPPGRSEKVPLGTGKSSFIFLVEHAGIKAEIGGEGKFAAKLVPRYSKRDGGSLSVKEQQNTKAFVQQEANHLMKLSRENPHINRETSLTTFGHIMQNMANILMNTQSCLVLAHIHPKYIHRDVNLAKKGSNGKASGVRGSDGYYAPELLLHPEDPFTDKVDMWSIGVTTYTFLAGCDFLANVKYFLNKDRPKHKGMERYNFDAFNETQLASIIGRDKYWIYTLLHSEDSDWLKGISSDGLDFMYQCLKPDPKERMSAIDALKHPFKVLVVIQNLAKMKLRKVKENRKLLESQVQANIELQAVVQRVQLMEVKN